MNWNSKNLDLCCRTCLRDDSEELYEIFQEEATGLVDIAELITSYTSIRINMEDRLPKKICNNCYRCLLNIIEFKRTALNADAELRKHFAKATIGDKQDVGSIKQNNNLIEIKIEEEYKEYQIENNFDDSVDSEMATRGIKEEKYPYITSTMYSDISDASLLEDPQAKRKITELNMEHFVTYRSGSKSKCFMGEINHKTDQRRKCDVCSKIFNSINSLSAHKRKHTPKDRVLSCSVCSKIFKKLSHLKRHELCHEINRLFKCSKCSRSFTTEATLTDHENKHNGIKPHQCPLCAKSFAHRSTLNSHIKIHKRDKLYLCPTCGKRFDSSTNLNQHIKRHSGLKLFACKLCPRKFVSKGELKSHGVTHTGEKSYKCDQCTATFTKCSSMTKHKLRHLGLKPYLCDACPMKFTCKDHLKRHNRIHTGERPYRCELCDRAFIQSADLVKHTRSHLGNNLYKCNQCSQSFRLKMELRQHISEHFISSQLEALKMTGSDTPQTLIDGHVGIVGVAQENAVVQGSNAVNYIKESKLLLPLKEAI